MGKPKDKKQKKKQNAKKDQKPSSQAKSAGEISGKGKATEKTQGRGFGAVWDALTSIPVRILSTIWSIVVWPFNTVIFTVCWIYKLLASIVAWTCKLPARFINWLFNCLPGFYNNRHVEYDQYSESIQQRQESLPTDVTNTFGSAFELFQEIERLKKELQQSEEQNKELDEKLARFQNQNKKLEEKLAGFQNQNKKLEEKLAGFQDQNKKLDEKLAGFQEQRKQLDEKLARLQNQNKKLEEKLAGFQAEINRKNNEIKDLQSKNEEQKTRLSKMASERMRENNPTVEDLNDPLRPTAVITKWTSLFRCGEYWTAYEEITSTKGESEAASTLYQICHVVYDSVKMYVDDLMEALQTVVTAATPPAENEEIEGFFPQEDERQEFLDALWTLHSRLTRDDASGNHKTRKLIVDLLKSKHPPDSMTKKVDEALGEELDFDPSCVKKFTDQLGVLIYYMRAQEIPMVVYFQGSKGTTFDRSLYEVEGSTGKVDPKSVVIKNVIRPVVLRNESGPVLSKGEIEVMSRSEWRAEKNHKSEAEGHVSSAKREVAGSSSRDVAVQTEDHASGAEIEDKEKEKEQVPPDDGTTGTVIENKPLAKEISPAEGRVAGSSSDAAVQLEDGNNEATMEGKPEAKDQVQSAGQEVAGSSRSNLLVKLGGHSADEMKTTEDEVFQAHTEVSGSLSSKAESEKLDAEAVPEGKMKDLSDLGTTSAPTGEGKKDHDHGFPEKGTSGGSCRKSLYDMSDCADHPPPESDGEGNDSSETKDTDKNKTVKEEAKQTASDIDGTPSSVSHSFTLTSPSTSWTCKAETLHETTKEPPLDANSPKESPSGPDEPAKTIPEKSPDFPSLCVKAKTDIEHTQEGNGSSFSDENINSNSSSGASSEETQSPEKASETEINEEKLEGCSEMSMGRTGNQCDIHDQSVDAPRENFQEIEKQLEKQSADGNHPELGNNPSTTLNEEHFSERSNSDSKANVNNAHEPPVTTSSHRTAAQNVGMNTWPKNGQQDVEANLPGKSQSPGVETGNLKETAHSNVTSPTEDRSNADDPGSDPLPEDTRVAENTKDSLEKKSPADTTTGPNLILPKPSHETIPPQEISFEPGEHSDTTAKPSSESSVIREGNQATSPDRNVSDPSESTGEKEDQHLEQSSPDPTAATCPAGTSSLNTGKGNNFAAASAVIENVPATDQEPEEIPNVPTTSQMCHLEVSGTNGNDSTESSVTEGSNQPTTQSPILNPDAQEGQEASTQQTEQPSNGKASSDPTAETSIPEDSQAPSSGGNLSQERFPESGGSSDADSNTLSDAVDQSSDLEAKRTEKMGDNYAASPADGSTSLIMTSPTNKGAEELATGKAAGESRKEADKQDEDMPE